MDTTTARASLEAERVTTLRRREQLASEHSGFVEASRDSNADDEHDPEGATIAFERSQVGALLRQADQHLEQIDAALARLAGASYGVCEVCGHQIPTARLVARPTATRCVGCAS